MIRTTLGAVLRVGPAPEHLGSGVMLYLSLDDPNDLRHTEVYLSPEVQLELTRELLNKYFPDTPAIA